MDGLLSGLKWKISLVYLDDVIVFGKSFDEHNKNLTEVVGILREAGMTNKPSKCTFAIAELRFLGHMVGHCGVRMDPGKISTQVEIFPGSSRASRL